MLVAGAAVITVVALIVGQNAPDRLVLALAAFLNAVTRLSFFAHVTVVTCISLPSQRTVRISCCHDLEVPGFVQELFEF